jgi:hypothetical protein
VPIIYKSGSLKLLEPKGPVVVLYRDCSTFYLHILDNMIQLMIKKAFHTLKKEPPPWLETLDTDYSKTWRHIPEERRPCLHRFESLKIHKCVSVCICVYMCVCVCVCVYV